MRIYTLGECMWPVWGLKPQGNPYLHVSLAPGRWAQPRGFWRGNIGFHARNIFRSVWFWHSVIPLTVVSVWGTMRWTTESGGWRQSHTCHTIIKHSTPLLTTEMITMAHWQIIPPPSAWINPCWIRRQIKSTRTRPYFTTKSRGQ